MESLGCPKTHLTISKIGSHTIGNQSSHTDVSANNFQPDECDLRIVWPKYFKFMNFFFYFELSIDGFIQEGRRQRISRKYHIRLNSNLISVEFLALKTATWDEITIQK